MEYTLIKVIIEKRLTDTEIEALHDYIVEWVEAHGTSCGIFSFDANDENVEKLS